MIFVLIFNFNKINDKNGGGGVIEMKFFILRFFYFCWFFLGLTKRYNNKVSFISKVCIKRKFELNFILILWLFGVSLSD